MVEHSSNMLSIDMQFMLDEENITHSGLTL